MATPESEVDNQRVADFYDQHTDVFSSVWGSNLHLGYWQDERDEAPISKATDQLTDQLITRLAPRAGHWVLDVGCGIGEPAQRLATHCDVRVVGVTISQQQSEQAMELAHNAGLGERLRFTTADAVELPFPDDCFDGAIALESMMHMAGKDRVLAEVHRVLRPDTRFVVADMFSQPGTTLTFQELITAPEMADYRELIDQSPFVLTDMTDITTHTLAPQAVFDRLKADLQARRDEVISVIGETEFEGLISDPVIPDSYGYLLATLSAN